MLQKKWQVLWVTALAIAVQPFALILTSSGAYAATSPAMFSTIDAGSAHTCGINSGKIYCWGYNFTGQLGNNTNTDSWIPTAVDTSGVLNGKTVSSISAGGYNTCALASGQVYCWGYNDSAGQLGNGTTNTWSRVPTAVDTTGVLAGKTVTSVSVGVEHSCALASGKVYCWGNNYGGALGNNSTTSSSVPVAVDTNGVLAGKSVTSISAGGDTTCALAAGKVYCWGYGGYGELGNNSTEGSLIPVAVNDSGVLAGKTISKIASGDNHICVLASSKVYCWGYGGDGANGNGSTSDSPVPVAVNDSGVLKNKTVSDITEGGNDTCAIASGKVYCWGYGQDGELGNNATSDSSVPVAVEANGALAGKSVTYTTVSGVHMCAIASGSVYCWGYNQDGELGNNTTLDSSVPVAVEAVGLLYGKTISSLSSENLSTCALASGKAYCWGNNDNGQLGNDSTTNSSIPTAVTTSGVLAGKTITSISMGYDHACAVASGNAYCWGANTSGTLGNNSTDSSQVPVAVDTSGVLAGKTVTAVAAGYNQACALASGKAYCWGDNTEGELGNNSTDSSQVPIAVDTSGVLAGKTITNITASGSHACVIASGKAYCWGDNYSGVLGNDSTNGSPVPVAVDTSGVLAGKTLTDIVTTDGHTCALASGKAYCWGGLYSIVLGNDSTDGSQVPVAVDTTGVLSGKTIVSITATGTHTCAITSDGKAYCWGYNNDGELGNNSTDPSQVPVAVDTSGVLAGKTVTGASVGSDHSCAIASGKAYCWGANYSGQLGNNSPNESDVPTGVYDGIVSTFFATPTLAIAAIPLTDNVIVSSTPTFSGTGEPGYSVEVTVHSDPVTCSDTVNSNGDWSCTLPTSLPAGEHTVTMTVMDLFGGVYVLGPTNITVAANDSNSDTDTTSPVRLGVGRPGAASHTGNLAFGTTNASGESVGSSGQPDTSDVAVQRQTPMNDDDSRSPSVGLGTVTRSKANKSPTVFGLGALGILTVLVIAFGIYKIAHRSR